MRAFHLMLFDAESSTPRRVDFHAAGPDHAFQVARNETDGVDVELWEGSILLARMTKTSANVWKLLPTLAHPEPDGPAAFEHMRVRHEGMEIRA